MAMTPKVSSLIPVSKPLQTADNTSLVLGMRHAKACPFIDIQRLMDLGIYAHEPNELKENIPPKTNIVPAVAEVSSIVTSPC